MTHDTILAKVRGKAKFLRKFFIESMVTDQLIAIYHYSVQAWKRHGYFHMAVERGLYLHRVDFVQYMR